MPSRTGLTNLIRRLRSMTHTSNNDYSLVIGDGSTVVWWSDSQLEEVMSVHMMDFQWAELIPQVEVAAGGTARYFYYQAPRGNLEEADSGTVYWRVADSTGSVVGTTNYTVDYVRGLIHFNSDTGGTSYYLRGRSFDLNLCAIDIWQEKQGSKEAFYAFKSDNQSFDRNQWFDHCKQMIAQYQTSSGLQVTIMRRADLLPPSNNHGGRY